MTDAESAYAIVIKPPARRALTDELLESVAFAAWEFIRGPLAERPRAVGTPLREPFAGLWRAKRGEYRIRFRIDDETRTVIILDVDHRRNAYRA